jgi:hypothetical protein
MRKPGILRWINAKNSGRIITYDVHIIRACDAEFSEISFDMQFS